MECPHLTTAAMVSIPALEAHARPGKTKKPVPVSIACKECSTLQSPWCCCHCGEIGCGRYVKGHMKLHYEHQKDHCVCMDCTSFAVYCYQCDEYVVNDSDSSSIQQLRAYFQNRDSSSPEQDIENSKRYNTRKRVHSRTHSHLNRKKNNHPKTVGLRNLGNTCFMNAVLQSLNNIPEFSGYIQKLPSLQRKQLQLKSGIKTRTTTDGNYSLVEEFRKTLIELRQSKTALSPASLFSVIWKVVPTFRGYQQQDAHEFMRYLLDRLHLELLQLLPRCSFSSRALLGGIQSSVVTAVFGGVLQSDVTCLECGTDSKKLDPFLDLSLDIPISRSVGNGDTVRLEDCLRSFTDIEELAETERYTCANCKKRQRSTKKFWIRRLPNVLCLHLKRFRWSSFLRTKIETFVQFPTQGLEMGPYQLNGLRRTRDSAGCTEYDLAAVVVHHGSGAGSGHYTSYATHEKHWYHFNDSSVSKCSEETVSKSKAYILFYIRRELKLR